MVDSLQCWQKAEGIFGSADRNGFALAKEVGKRGEKVGGANGLGGSGAGFHPAGPAHEEGHAMTAFVDVGLVTAPVGVGLVAFFHEVRNRGGWRAAVVRGEDDDGVVDELLLIQFSQHFADNPVGFHQEIAILANARFALPFFRRDNRRVGAGEW